MKKVYRRITLLTISMAMSFSVLAGWPMAKVTVKVVGENGTPISNALVYAGFPQGGNAWRGEHKSETLHGLSDTNGCFTAEARSEMTVGGSVVKTGYYRSFWDYTFQGDYQTIKHWKPWNPVQTVFLLKIINPIPMYAKHVPIQSEMPEINNPVGYDLMLGDWVTPHGKGQNADIIFMAKRRVASWKDFETHLSLSFSDLTNGIQTIQTNIFQRSALRLPRMAPETAYHPAWTNSIGYVRGKGYFQTQKKGCPGYFFRVRSVVDDNGNLVEALYGKINGPIVFDARDSETVHIQFTYYLNPTPQDRNMEFDPKHNLLKNLKSNEQVTAP